MAEFSLTATSPLAGFSRDFDGISLAETTGRAIVSIATPLGGETALRSAIQAAFNMDLPDVGGAAASGTTYLLRLAIDQAFLVFDAPKDDPVTTVAHQLGAAGYFTDQSDSWALLSMTGPRVRRALERICPLDLDPDAFPVGMVARTSMEHLGVIILHDSPNSFLLMSPTSSAGSFCHAVETSCRNIQST